MTFRDALRAAHPTADELRTRRWRFIPYDRLTDAVGPLARESPRDVGLVFVESRDKARRRPYHRRKLALLLSNERHFALEMAAKGYRILYARGDGTFGELLRETAARHGLAGFDLTRPAERELRADLDDARAQGLTLTESPDETWLSTDDDFDRACPAAPYRMDAFYREVRRRTGVLMAKAKPVGGRFSFDGENRLPWHGQPAAPPRFSVTPDAITREVLDLVATAFPHAWGTLDGYDLPASRDDALAAWRHAREHALPHFGPFEDAMSAREATLFHTLASPLLNLSRLTPRQLVDDALADLDAGRLTLASAEGFVRQVLGWREFVRHVHARTDGFRTLSPAASPDALAAAEPLPAAWWATAPSGLRCLDTVVDRVWKTGYAHHIERLMVLANIATLIGVSPRALTDWFWAGFIDAYDWVVEPNVLGMGTFADGGLMTTKPYVSGGAYVDRMSDFCDGCRFDPSGRNAQRPCPLTPMYWDLLGRNRARLATLERMKLPLAAQAKRTDAQKRHDEAVTLAVRRHLREGNAVPADVARVAK